MFLSAIAVIASMHPSALADEDAPSSMDFSASMSGSCIAESGPVDLRRVMFLENRSLDLDGPAGRIRIELRGQSTRIITLPDTPDQTIRRQHIGGMVAQGEEDADVHLKLALLDDALMLYWRETYQHRLFRQGLFRIDGNNLTRLCEGHSGSATTH